MMMSHLELRALVERGVIKIDHDGQIGSASIDITLDRTIMVEAMPNHKNHDADFLVDLMRGGKVNMTEVDISDDGYSIVPGEFILGSSREPFELPNDVVGIYCLNSSLGRSGLEHMSAGFIDPGFHGKLTLEMFNVLRYHRLVIREGMKIGQIVFHKVSEVPEYASYRTTGQYNGQGKVTASLGLRTPGYVGQ